MNSTQLTKGQKKIISISAVILTFANVIYLIGRLTLSNGGLENNIIIKVLSQTFSYTINLIPNLAFLITQSLALLLYKPAPPDDGIDLFYCAALLSPIVIFVLWLILFYILAKIFNHFNWKTEKILIRVTIVWAILNIATLALNVISSIK